MRARLTSQCFSTAAVLAAAAVPRRRVQCQYEVTVIVAPSCPITGNPPPTFGIALNESGHVAGYQYKCDGLDGFEAFLWTPEEGYQVLTRPPGVTRALARDINESGVIVGTMYTPAMRGFVWKDGVWTELPPQPGGAWSGASAINDLGQVTGMRSLENESDIRNAFIWSAEEGFLDLGVMGGPRSEGRDINNQGQVTGWMGTGSPAADTTTFLWSDGVVEDLGFIRDGITSQPYGINVSGQLTGNSSVPEDTSPTGYYPHAFMYADGAMLRLDTLTGFEFSLGHGINDHGTVVGLARTIGPSGTTSRAVIWHHGQVFDLNASIPDDHGVLTSASAINNRGQITATNSSYTLLLTPVGHAAADVNVDCRVDLHDLCAVLAAWGAAGSLADVDQNGTVDVNDLVAVIISWTG